MLFFNNLHSNDISKSLKKFGLNNIKINNKSLVVEKIERIIKNFDEYPTGKNSFNDFRLNALSNCFLFYNFFDTTYENVIIRDLIKHYLNNYRYQYEIQQILYKNIEQLSEVELNEYHDIFLDKNIELLETISILFAKKKIKLEDKKINELIVLFENKKDFDFSYLYEISSGITKGKVKRLIKKQLDNNFDIDLYIKYSLLNIIDYKIHFNKLIQRIKFFSHINYNDLGFEERFFIDDHQFHNLILFILYKNLKEEDFSDLEQKSDILLFFIKRENINVTEFNIEFIRYFKRDKNIIEYTLKCKNISELVTKYVKNNKADKDITQLYIKHIL